MDTEPSLPMLPPEILLEIAAFSVSSAVSALAQTCRVARDVVSDPLFQAKWLHRLLAGEVQCLDKQEISRILSNLSYTPQLGAHYYKLCSGDFYLAWEQTNPAIVQWLAQNASRQGDLAMLNALLDARMEDHLRALHQFEERYRIVASSALVAAVEVGCSRSVGAVLSVHRPAAKVVDLAVGIAASCGFTGICKVLLHLALLMAEDDYEVCLYVLESAAAGNHCDTLSELLDLFEALPVPTALMQEYRFKALLQAAKLGHYPVAQLMLTRGVEAATEHNVALTLAAQEGHLEVMDVLLAAGADCSAVACQAMRKAIVAGQLAAVELLVSHGASPYVAMGALEASGSTLLAVAAGSGSVEMVQWVLQRPRDLWYACQLDGALLHAAGRGSLKVMELLLDHGADVHYSCGNDSALKWAARSERDLAVELLLVRGADASGPAGMAALMTAASNGNPCIVKMLLDEGADANAVEEDDVSSVSVLTYACGSGSTAVVRLLLERGADLEACAPAAMLLAAAEGNVDVIRLLLSYGVRPVGSAELDPPLATAAGEGHLAAMACLIAAGADVDEDHGAPLRAAATRGRIESLRFLLMHGAEPAACGPPHPVILALEAGHAEAARWLWRWQPPADPSEQRWAIRAAVQTDDLETLDYMLEHLPVSGMSLGASDYTTTRVVPQLEEPLDKLDAGAGASASTSGRAAEEQLVIGNCSSEVASSASCQQPSLASNEEVAGGSSSAVLSSTSSDSCQEPEQEQQQENVSWSERSLAASAIHAAWASGNLAALEVALHHTHIRGVKLLDLGDAWLQVFVMSLLDGQMEVAAVILRWLVCRPPTDLDGAERTPLRLFQLYAIQLCAAPTGHEEEELEELQRRYENGLRSLLDDVEVDLGVQQDALLYAALLHNADVVAMLVSRAITLRWLELKVLRDLVTTLPQSSLHLLVDCGALDPAQITAVGGALSAVKAY